MTDEIRNLAAGPLFTIIRNQAMYINGYTFYTMAQDKKSVYQNSSVRVRAVIDDNHDDDDTKTHTYYGQIEEIWELDYVGLKVALSRCRWVTNGKRDVSKDKYGYVSVDLRVLISKRRGLANPRRLSYGQETRINEPTSPLLHARDED
jgi:hypothetical protein